MKHIPLYIMIIVSLFLGGFYLYELKQEKSVRMAKQKSKMLFPDLKARPSQITLRRGKSMINIQMDSVNGSPLWVITSPIRTKADQESVDALINTLKKLKYMRIISGSKENLSDFGLDDPSLLITITAGNKSKTLILGGLSPVKDGYYAMISGNKNIYLISTSAHDILNMNLYDLRDKGIFSLKAGNVKRLTINRDHFTWNLIKLNDKWHLQGEPDFPVDTLKINNLLGQLLRAKATSFEGKIPDDLDIYGLTHPIISVSVSDGEKEEEILIGTKKSKGKYGHYFAMLKGKKEIITVDEYFLDIIPVKKEAFKRLD